jgi:hypothetical protein
MRKLTVLLLLLSLTIAACGPEEVVELPTLAVLPPLEPSPTFPPSATPTATATASNTPTPTTTNTVTPTASFTPSRTFTPSVTPTTTLTFTPSATPTPTATPTATFTATSEVAVITTLSVSPQEAEPGQRITLTWAADADVVAVAVQDQQGETLNSLTLPPRGSQDFFVPEDASDLVVYRLTATRNGESVAQSVPVIVLCGGEWFFEAQGIIVNDDCPDGDPNDVVGRVQVFENGYMIWLPQANRVYVLYGGDNGGTFSAFSITSPTQVIPAAPGGLFPPELEFEGVWLETEDRAGRDWMGVIGYGTQPAQQYTITRQDVGGNPNFYIDVGNIFLFKIQPGLGDPTFGAWERLRANE